MNQLIIETIAEVPPPIATPFRRELNLLWYGPSELLAAYEGETLVGVIRTALRVHPQLKHGLITDLYCAKPEDIKNCAPLLIQAAEKKLLAQGATKIDALIMDGNKISDLFIAQGYWASRKTVVVEWDLADVKAPELSTELDIAIETTYDPIELAEFILHSYQPYWTWWKDDAFDRLWDRIDYPSMEPDEIEQKNTEENRAKVIEMLTASQSNPEQTFFIARQKSGEKKIVALCDTAFEWGAMLLRDHPGKGLGNYLVLSALHWLKEKGATTAEATTTSGMDDFDPTVYLYVQSCGGKIKGEFLDMVKRKFS
ncbi:GNAT family N-acetyltransferase [Candidatus Gracilibacteria bacterium]|nr:GNAT family N-acetyltransferase [Candidatus Gracilibacteria bacterium]